MAHPGASSQSRRKNATAVVVITISLLIVMWALLAALFSSRNSEPPAPVPAQGCRVNVDGFSTYLTHEQSLNASIIVGESIRRGLVPRAASIALTTAYQESDIRNLDYGDRDSVGLFQQRPSQGWGSVEQIMDPWYSSGKFYEVLVTIPGWETGDINDVAQAVQRSGFPHAYRQHEQKGRSWASALTGHSSAAVSCVDRLSPAADGQSLVEFLQRVYGAQITIDAAPTRIVVNTPDQTTAWAVAQLSLLRSRSAGIEQIAVGDVQLRIGTDQLPSWQPINQQATPRPLPAAGVVEITLRP